VGKNVTQNVPRQNASEIKALKLPRDCIMRNLYKANRVVKWHGTNGTISRRPKSKSDSSLGLRKLGPKRGGNQGELAGTRTSFKCIPKGWLVMWPTREVMTPLTYFKCSLGLRFGKPKCCFSYLDKQTF
jgi:hypothetical protein